MRLEILYIWMFWRSMNTQFANLNLNISFWKSHNFTTHCILEDIRHRTCVNKTNLAGHGFIIKWCILANVCSSYASKNWDLESSILAVDTPQWHQYCSRSHHTQYPTHCSYRSPLCPHLECYHLPVAADQLYMELHKKVVLQQCTTYCCNTKSWVWRF